MLRESRLVLDITCPDWVDWRTLKAEVMRALMHLDTRATQIRYEVVEWWAPPENLQIVKKGTLGDDASGC